MEILKNFDIRMAKTVTREKIPEGTPGKYVLHNLNVKRTSHSEQIESERFELEMKDARGKNFINEIDYQTLIFIVAREAALKLCSSERAIQKFNFIKK